MKWGVAIFISWIFFFIFRSQLFQLSSFMSLEMCCQHLWKDISILSSPVIFKQNFKTYRLQCEVGWCHFHFLDFFLHTPINFPFILKKCPNRLHCEMGWCHFHFLDFFLHISSDIPIIWKLPQYAALWSKVVPFLFLGVLLFWCVPFSFLWFLFLIFPVIFL